VITDNGEEGPASAGPSSYAGPMGEPSIDPTIMDHYENRYDEDRRIRSGIGELELVRTREIVRRHLPDGPCRILDVGGGTGVHSEWLLDDGHTVDLIDPVPRHVAAATDRLSARPRFTAEIGEARELAAAADTYDAVLLFGPLYHLTDRADRIVAWSEAGRVARPGGIVVGAVISRFASLLSGLSGGAIFDDAFRSIIDRDLTDGQHRNPDPDTDWFTTAYFHHPDEVAPEVEAAGLAMHALLGVEGISFWVEHLERSWDDPARREVIVEAARRIEDEATLLGLGPHLLAVATT